MTGRYPVRYGMQYGVIIPGAPWALPLSEKVGRREVSCRIVGSQRWGWLGRDQYGVIIPGSPWALPLSEPVGMRDSPILKGRAGKKLSAFSTWSNPMLHVCLDQPDRRDYPNSTTPNPNPSPNTSAKGRKPNRAVFATRFGVLDFKSSLLCGFKHVRAVVESRTSTTNDMLEVLSDPSCSLVELVGRVVPVK